MRSINNISQFRVLSPNNKPTNPINSSNSTNTQTRQSSRKSHRPKSIHALHPSHLGPCLAQTIKFENLNPTSEFKHSAWPAQPSTIASAQQKLQKYREQENILAQLMRQTQQLQFQKQSLLETNNQQYQDLVERLLHMRRLCTLRKQDIQVLRKQLSALQDWTVYQSKDMQIRKGNIGV